LILIVLRSLDALSRGFVSPATNAYLGDAYSEEKRGSAFGAYQTTAMIGAAAGPVVGGAIAEFGGIRLPFLVLGAGTLVGGLVLFAFLPSVDGEDDPTEDETLSILPDLSRRSIGMFLSVPAIAWLATAFINEFGTTTLNPIFPLLLHETVGRGPAYVGTTYSALAVAMLIFMPIGGRFADRLGRVRVLTVTPIGWCIVMVGLAVAADPLVPPLLMFLGGILSAFAAPASLALRYEIAPDGREATFSGLTGTVSSTGKAVGPMFAGVVTGLWGVRMTAIVAGLSWLVAVPLFFFFVPETRDSNSE
jgi:MFS family permease